jgi:hypothetical protein
MSSSIIYVGKSLATLIESAEASITYDEDGIASAELNYTVLWASAPALVESMVAHPDFPFLIRKAAKITRMDANMAKVSVSFEGVDPEKNDDDDSARYSVKGSTSNEPIESHPNFSTFAGKWDDQATWVNGATFIKKGQKDEGKFLGFKPPSSDGSGGSGGGGSGGSGAGTGNSKAGTKSYLGGGMIFRQTKTYGRTTSGDSVAAQLAKLGKVDEPPRVSSFVEVPEGRDWLLITCSVDQAGEGIKVTREWRLSGRNGWDQDIYT